MIETANHLTCDRCKLKDIPGTQTISLFVSRRSNGNDMDDVYRDGELCPRCMKHFLEALVRGDIVSSWDCFSNWREVLR